MEGLYLDYQSTSPCDARVLEKMLPFFCIEFGNPHSYTHDFGYIAREAVEEAREKVAHIIGAENPKEIIFTSGATESNNLAIKGAAHFYRSLGNKIITCKTEHKCVLESCKALEKEGFEVVYLDVDNDGLIDFQQLEKELTPNVVLVSVMTVNNEIGVIQDIAKLAKLCKSKNPNLIFHTDAAQAVGKIDMKVVGLENIDLMSISGHKIYGPKGVGALYVRMKPKRVRLVPLFDGGGQERGMRSGTLPVPLCVGLGEACRIAEEEFQTDYNRILGLRNYLLKNIQEKLSKVYVNGSLEHRIPGNLNLNFYGIEGEGIMMGLKGVAVSSGSACTSETLEGSYVIRALGGEEANGHSSIRIGLGRFTTKAEIDKFIEVLIPTVERLRAMSPVWND